MRIALAPLFHLLAAGLLGAGLLGESPAILAAGTFAVGLAAFLADYLRRDAGDVSPLSFYALAAGVWFGLANLLGFLSRGGPWESRFFTWQDDRYLFEGQCIAALGVVVPVLAGAALESAGRRRVAALHVPPLPTFGNADRLAAVLAATAWAARLPGDADAIPWIRGRVATVVSVGAALAVFLLVTDMVRGRTRRTPARVAAVGVLLVGEILHAGVASDLRSDIATPLAAAFLPVLAARALRPRHLPLLLAGTVLFVAVFEPMKSFRLTGASAGTRVRALTDAVAEGPVDLVTTGAVAVTARLSTFNQLSRIAALVDEGGTRDGETLAYVAYVFVPRALWPGKPAISPGRDFARALGRGAETETGWSNAVNMTVPGEMYLNFRWVGVVGGMFAFAALLVLLRNSLGGRVAPGDPVGRVVGFFVVTQAVVVGSHAGALVNLVLWWIFLVTGRWAWLAVARVLRRQPRPAPGP